MDAKTSNGLRATAWIYVEPEFIDPPAILSAPKLSAPKNGTIDLTYTLDLEGRPDQSLVTWSISDTPDGINERTIAISRGNKPHKTLTLTPGMVGKTLKATIRPRHQRCEPGEPLSVISAAPVSAANIPSTTISPNFRHFVNTPNNSFKNGLWTISKNWKIEYGSGLENEYGIHSKGPASLFYQNDTNTGDMQLDLWFRPDKTAGQVFSVPGSPQDNGPNNLHADIFIKYDPRTGNGVSLRFWRTTQSGRAVMFQFYKIENGTGTPLSEQQVLSSVFKRDTHLILKAEGNTLSVHADNTKNATTLQLETGFEPNRFGGCGMRWPRGTSAICSRFEISYPQSGL